MIMENYLNGGLYRNTCQKLNLFVKNVIKNLKDGLVKIQDFVLMNADLKYYTEKLQKKEKQERCKDAQPVKKNSMFLDGNLSQREEDIVLKNVIGRINQIKLRERIIFSISMEELKNMQKHFIFQQNGEISEKKFIKEIIGLVKNVGKKEENFTPIIKYQLENAKTHYQKETSLPYAESVIVLNNRQEVQNEFV